MSHLSDACMLKERCHIGRRITYDDYLDDIINRTVRILQRQRRDGYEPWLLDDQNFKQFIVIAISNWMITAGPTCRQHPARVNSRKALHSLSA